MDHERPMRDRETLILLLSAMLIVTGCPAEKQQDTVADDPVQVVRQYLQTSATGDLSSLKDLVDSKCYKKPVGRVEATQTLGSRMKLESVAVELSEREGSRASVRFKVKGSLVKIDVSKLKGPVTEVDIRGQRVEVRPPTVSIAGIERSGTLELVRSDGRWRVTCK